MHSSVEHEKVFITSGPGYRESIVLITNHHISPRKTDFQPLFECVLIFILYLGPVVQSIVSLTSSLRGQLVKCFTTL